MNSLLIQSLPTPHPSLLIPVSPRNPASHGTLTAFQFSDPAAARKAYHAKKLGWAALPLRQDFADEVFMREHIKEAALRSPISTEPATVSRLRTQLTRAGVFAPEIRECLGTTLSGYLELNPMLPLWAALGLVLEATGRFTPKTTVDRWVALGLVS
jgi:hypothetical protein